MPRRITVVVLAIAFTATTACAEIPTLRSPLAGDSLQRSTAGEPTALLVGREFDYTVQRGDSLSGIGARYGVSAKALASRNGIRLSTRLRPGQVLRVDNRHIVPATLENGILINLPQRLLFLFEDGRLVAWYPVAVGQPDWQTPTGSFRVMTRETDPVWDVPVSIQREMARKGEPVRKKVPPGPDNPLGEYWIGLSATCCGIHSTNAPQSVYQFQTHGCVRMNPEDAEDLFYRIEVGVPVEIIYEPVLVGRNADGTTLVEVHPDIYNRLGSRFERAAEIAETRGIRAGSGSTEWEEAFRGEEGIPTPVGISADR
jgi:L,D-transpeptidase ErfK/SrfK